MTDTSMDLQLGFTRYSESSTRLSDTQLSGYVERIYSKSVSANRYKDTGGLPIFAARRSSIGPSGSEDGAKMSSCSLALPFRDGVDDEGMAASFLSRSHHEEILHTPLVTDDFVLGCSLVAVQAYAYY